MAFAFAAIAQLELITRPDDGYQAGPAWLNIPLVLATPVLLVTYDIHMPPARSLSNTVFALGLFGIAWVLGWALRRYADQRVALAAAVEQLEAGQVERERFLADETGLVSPGDGLSSEA